MTLGVQCMITIISKREFSNWLLSTIGGPGGAVADFEILPFALTNLN